MLRNINSADKNRNSQRSSRILQASILAISAVLLAQAPAGAEVISGFNFGPNGTTPSILTPTTVGLNVVISPITADAGATLDISSGQGNPPSTAPWLRVVPNGTFTTAAAAVTGNVDFKWTVDVTRGSVLNLNNLVFDAIKGGAGTRGFAVRSSVDGFGANLFTSDITAQRGVNGSAMQSFASPDLTANALYQGLTTITFKIYSYSNGNGSSVEYDNIVLNGSTTLGAGFVWAGTTDNNWDVTTSNWTGVGPIYADAVQTSNVRFSDGPANNNITVAGGGLNPNNINFDGATTPYTFSGGSLTLVGNVTKDGASSATFNNTVTTAATIVNGGSLTIAGTYNSPVVTVNNGGTLLVQAATSLGSNPALTASGAVTLNSATQAVASLNGANTGVLTLNGTALSIAGAGTHAGQITGNGSITKTAAGTLTLSGTTNNFSGGITVNAGAVALANATAGGTGAISVSNNAILSLSGAAANAINLNGAILGVSSGSTLTNAATVTVTGNNIVRTFNPITGATGNDLILSGLLQGTGNITVANANGALPDGTGFRLRGGASSYSGTITLNQSSKFEIQTSLASGSQMGTGKLVMTGGTINATNGGSFSLVNLRNNHGGGSTNLGNNVEIAGTGSVLFNMLGNALAGSTTTMGDLLIGNNQTAIVGASAGNVYNLFFPTVHLTGGNATFAPRPAGNTNYVVNDTLTLGTITENTVGAGITMNGLSTLTLTGVNSYTGATSLLNGTTVLGPGASIATSSSITVAPTATFNVNDGTLAVPAAQTVTVNGTMNSAIGLSGTLAGSGAVNGAVTALTASHIAPVGLLSIGNLDLQGGSSLDLDLAKAVPGTIPTAGADYDQLSVSDFSFGLTPTVSLSGNLNLTLGSGIEFNDIFTIVRNNGFDALTGTFSGLANGATFTVGGQQFQISYGDDALTPAFELTGGNDVSLLAVPEPGSLTLVLGGIALCALGRRRRTASPIAG